MKRKERENQLLQDGGINEKESIARPKSAKAAQMALTATYQLNVHERSLAARQALAYRLNQELNESEVAKVHHIRK